MTLFHQNNIYGGAGSTKIYITQRHCLSRIMINTRWANEDDIVRYDYFSVGGLSFNSCFILADDGGNIDGSICKLF